MSYKKQIAEKISIDLKRKNVTKYRIRKDTGIGANLVDKIRKGKGNYNIDTADNLSDYLDTFADCVQKITFEK